MHLHAYSREIALAVEGLINLPYALKYNASYSEYFYGFSLSGESALLKVLNLAGRLLWPYILMKLQNHLSKLEGSRKRALSAALKILKGIDLVVKLRYLLNNN